MEPPACVQNAMMKQTKKPFTYTPGGIDLSEIKSPRMARRIERNANNTGASDNPRQPPPPPPGPLPPSALAAMQPQMHVQVFPSGPSPRAAPPPPPPPPAPMQPLPIQKVVGGDNQVVERPDMTKIIPDNPMMLLRKTGGPQPRKSLLDEVYTGVPQSAPQKQVSPPVRAFQQSPPVQVSPPVRVFQQSPPVQVSPPVRAFQQSPPVQQNQVSPPVRAYQQSPPVQVSSPNQWNQYQPSVIERAPEPVSNNHYQPKVIERNQEQPIKTSTAHLGSLYIPPINQQSVSSPPAPPRRDPQVQSPSTPTLKEAPRPWQKQQKQSEELPPWAKREENAQNPTSPAPNAVYVTQPVVLQHPGPAPNRQPQTPTLNRQQSWSNNPTQSNSFKVIQKMTEQDEDDDGVVVEHTPKYPQHFQQAPPGEQMRKLKLTEGDRDLMNRFRQEEEDPRYRGGLIPSRVFRILDASGVDDEASLHNEVDPRYRGAAIPSKAFKLLQSMTDGTPEPSSIGATVSRGSPAGNRTPQVRNIPIQIERDDEPKNYVHPSEQTVPEPKKYTGSSIPSRSFRMLQAMTAPDNCANANEVNEHYDPSSCNPWGYEPHYPPPPPYYPPDYYYNYYYPPPPPKEQGENCESRDIRQTPVPWGYYPYPYMGRPVRTPSSDLDSDSETVRGTPVPFYGYYPYCPPTPTSESEDNSKEPKMHPHPYQYPPYWDPYYYYYGYPPVYSPYPYYGMNSDTEEGAGYSSNEEMAFFGKKMEEKQQLSTKTPRIVVTPTLPDEILAKPEIEEESSDSESETDVEEEEEIEEIDYTNSKQRKSNSLQAIKSVQDITIYDQDLEEEAEEEEEPYIEECSEDTTEENDDSSSIYIVENDTIPHELSVIFEESERTDNSRRPSSVLSDSTTIAEKSDSENYDEEEIDVALNIKLPMKFNNELKEDCNLFASFTVETPSVTEDLKEATKVEKEEEEDWWGILAKDEDTISTNTKSELISEDSEVSSSSEDVETVIKVEDSTIIEEPSIDEEVPPPRLEEASEDEEDDDASSTSSNDSSSSESNASKKSSSEEIVEPLSIKDRIQALKDSINSKRNQSREETEIKTSVKDKVSAIETGSKTTSMKSSVRSFEEFSEEEGDSGVTSDMSRHISDSEEFPELKKMTRYQRAATHSRLFKLLQEECDEDEDEVDEEEEVPEEKPDKFSKLSVRRRLVPEEPIQMRRDQLSLPLKDVSDESLSSSGITSPGSPINEKLVTELVQSVLKKKKGQVFRNLPKEKLQAAAKKILQEEIDDMSTPDSSFLSPLRNGTESSTPAQTPQEFYNDYKNYYDSWGEAYDESYDILPSKAFKLLQEHSISNRTGAIAGLLAKCPKVLSSKNVHQELMRFLESSESQSLEPSSEVTTAS